MVAEARAWPPLSAHRQRSVLLYSHDTYGLGHFRRNSAIAHAMRRHDPAARIVMLTGSSLAGSWQLPPGVEFVRMPSVIKVGADDYRPATPRPMSELRAERANIINSTLSRMRPDVFLVDHAPLGMKGELKWALEFARERLTGTHVVLGLRDILDDPHTVRTTWAEQSVYPALAHLYDQILVYGCRELFDVTEHYAFEPSVRRRTVFTGYIAKDQSLEPIRDAPDGWRQCTRKGARRILVMGGGGGDAAELFHAFIEAWPMVARATESEALLVTGPMMAASDRLSIERMAAKLTELHFMRSSTGMLRLIEGADVVVSMGGYNSVVESLSARRPLVLFPRTAPRREQLIRARLLDWLGLARLVQPGPAASRQMAAAVLQALVGPSPKPEAWRSIDLGGGDRVARLLLNGECAEAVAT